MGFLLVLGVALFTAITASLVSFFVSSPRRPSAVTARILDADPYDALDRLAAAAARGTITQQEYLEKRAELLSRI